MDRSFGLGLVGLAVASAYLYGATFINPTAFGDPVGAAGLPTILGWLLVAVSLLILAQAAVSRYRGTAKVTADGPDDGDGAAVFDADPGRAWLRGMGVVALAVAYIVVLPYAGYPIAAGLLLFAMALYFGMPLTWRVPVVAVSGALAMWVLFGVVFRIRLPMGLLAPFFG